MAFSQFFERLIYFSLILIPFAPSFSSRLTNILIAVAVVPFWIKKALSRDATFLKKVPIVLPFSLIVLASFISFVKTVSLPSSLGGIGKLIKYLGLFLVFAEELKDKKHVQRIVTALLLGLLLASVDGIFQLYFGVDFIRQRPYDIDPVGLGLPRLRAAFPSTNHFSTYLALFLPLSICLTFYDYRGFKKFFVYATSILALSCLLFTFARGSFIGFLIALAFIGVMKQDKMILIALAIVLVVAPFALPQQIKNWEKTTHSPIEVIWDAKKIGDWRNALNMIRHNLWTGVGVNTYGLNFEKYQVKDASRFRGEAGYAHNIYLQMMAEIGPLGLIAFLWLLVRLFRLGLESYRRLDDNFLKTATLGILAGLTAFLYNGITETVLYHSKIVCQFWFYVGLLLGICRLSRQNQWVDKK